MMRKNVKDFKSVNMQKDFAVFVLSHGRAKEMTTVNMLKRYKYTGDWFVVIDNEDSQANLYIEKYGKKHIIVFDKKAEEQRMDTGDNEGSRKCGVFARNFIIDEADRRGYPFHVQLDDDYQGFDFRYIKGGKLKAKHVEDINNLFRASLKFYINADLDCLAYGVFADYVGGANNGRYFKGVMRKTMNVFFLRADRKFYFVARMNDDVTTNLINNKIGKKLLSVTYVQTRMPATQAMKGGMAEIYTNEGTYMKSFYSVMFEPSACKVDATMKHMKRVHHRIRWNRIAPRIIDEKYKKK